MHTVGVGDPALPSPSPRIPRRVRRPARAIVWSRRSSDSNVHCPWPAQPDATDLPKPEAPPVMSWWRWLRSTGRARADANATGLH